LGEDRPGFGVARPIGGLIGDVDEGDVFGELVEVLFEPGFVELWCWDAVEVLKTAFWE